MKKILAIIMVILLPMIAFGQSKEADKYFFNGELLYFGGEYEEAIQSYIKSDSLEKIELNASAPNYHRSELKLADCFNRLSLQYDNSGNYTEAIKLGTQALEIRRKVLGEEHPDYALSLNNLTIDYAKIGNYTEAIRLGTQASEILKKFLGEEHPDYALSLDNLAYLNNTIGNYTEAIRLGTQASEILKKILGEEHSDYAISLNNLASYYDEIGNHTEAIKLGTQALEILKKVFGEEHPFYATSLNNLAYCNSEIGNYTEAIRLGTRALEIHKKALGEEHPDYANSLANLAGYYENIGNYTEAIRLGTRALEIRKKALGGEHPDYAKSLNDLAVYYAIIGNNTEAIRLGTQALEIRKKALGGEHPDYAQSLNNLANYYFVINEYDKGGELLNQYYSIVHSNILHNFASMTATERNNYWTQKNYGSLNSIPQAAALSNTPKAYTLAYNFLLFTKGLLLNAEIEIQSLIAKSGNTNLENRWITLRSNQLKLDKLNQLPLNQRTINSDSLKSLIAHDEKYLMENIKELDDYTRNLSIEWQDVQKHLSSSDVAIEFFIESDTTYALLLKKDFDAPKLVRLSKATFDAPYSNTDMYKGIWQPLEKYFSPEGNIYFSPSGILHTLAIEHAPINDTMTISDRYKHLYRVSSTRNIALSVAHNADNTAALFGGIEYGAERDTIVKYFADIARGSDSKGWEYLRNTYIEVVSIDTVLNQTGFKTETLTRSAASEENFKRLRGRNHRIIHTSTHGYFRIDSTASDNLINTGLVFAGANNIKPYDDIDDGLLTAQEISRLDLHNTDLVVLSACETALGTVTSEGVFGIQRGFKKAGVNTIVMSIKEVYDTATMEFMVEFYKNMMRKGIVKHDAFVSAVHAMRKKYPDDPDKWATFIMLDGN